VKYVMTNKDYKEAFQYGDEDNSKSLNPEEFAKLLHLVIEKLHKHIEKI